MSQGKRGGNNVGLAQFMGKSWTAWQDYAATIESKASKKEEEDSTPSANRGSSVKLRADDMPLFGCCPSQDEFYLVVCEHCDIVVKPQALRSHIELRHPQSLDARWSDSPPATAVGPGGDRGVEAARSRLSVNPSPTPPAESNSSSSLSAGGPSSRSTPSPSRSSSAGSSQKKPKSKSRGKAGRQKKVALPLVLVDRLSTVPSTATAPKTVALSGPRDAQESIALEGPTATSSSKSGVPSPSSMSEIKIALADAGVDGMSNDRLGGCGAPLEVVAKSGAKDRRGDAAEDKVHNEASTQSAAAASLNKLNNTKTHPPSTTSFLPHSLSRPPGLDSPPVATQFSPSASPLPDPSTPPPIHPLPSSNPDDLSPRDSPLPDDKTDSGPESRSNSRPASRSGSRPGSRGGGSRTGSRPGSRPGSRGGSRPGSRGGSRAGSRTGSRAGSRSGSRSGSRAGSRSGSRAGSRSGSRGGSRPSSRPHLEIVSASGAENETRDPVYDEEDATSAIALSPASDPSPSASTAHPPVVPMKPTFLPVMNEVKKKNVSVAMTLAQISGALKSASSSSPTKKPSQGGQVSPAKTAIAPISAANLISTVKRKDREAERARGADARRAVTLTPQKRIEALSLSAQTSIIDPFDSTGLSSLDLPPFSSPRTDAVSMDIARPTSNETTPTPVRETDTSIQSILNDLAYPDTLLISPTDVLQSQTPVAHQGNNTAAQWNSFSPSSSRLGDQLHSGVGTNQGVFGLSGDVSDSSPSKQSPVGDLFARRKPTLCKDRTYDPDRHCGVAVEGNGFSPCTRSLTCKSHNLSARRQVKGRSKTFDVLLSEHKAAKDAKLREQGKLPPAKHSAAAPSPSSKSPCTSSAAPSWSSPPPLPEIPVDRPEVAVCSTSPSTVVHYPGSSISNNFVVPAPAKQAPSSSSPRTTFVRSPPKPLPRSFQPTFPPTGSRNQAFVPIVPRPFYISLSELDRGAGEGGNAESHQRGVAAPKGVWPTSALPPQPVAMCSFGARATPSELPSSCASGSCMFLGRKMDLFRSAFKVAVDRHLHPPPIKKSCLSSSSAASSAAASTTGSFSTPTENFNLDPSSSNCLAAKPVDISTSIGVSTFLQSGARGSGVSGGGDCSVGTLLHDGSSSGPMNPATFANFKTQLMLQQQQQTAHQSQLSSGSMIPKASPVKPDVNANLNGAPGRLSRGGSIGVVGGTAGSSGGSGASGMVGMNVGVSSSAPSITSQLHAGQTLTKSSSTSAIKRKRSSSSLSCKGDDTVEQGSSAPTGMPTGLSSPSKVGGAQNSTPNNANFANATTSKLSLQQQHTLQQPQRQSSHFGTTQTALTPQRLCGENNGQLSISIPFTGVTMASTQQATFRQLPDVHLRKTSTTALTGGMSQVLMSSGTQLQVGPIQGQTSVTSRLPVTTGTIYLSSGGGLTATGLNMQTMTALSQQQPQQSLRLGRTMTTTTTTSRSGLIQAQVVVSAPAASPTKLQSVSAVSALNRGAVGGGGKMPARKDVSGLARSFQSRSLASGGLGPRPSQSTAHAVSSGPAMVSATFAPAISLSQDVQTLIQNASPDSSLSSSSSTSSVDAGTPHRVGVSAVGCATNPTSFAVQGAGASSSLSSQRDARLSSPHHGIASSSASSSSASQVLSNNNPTPPQLHIPNGFMTLPSNHSAAARAALLGSGARAVTGMVVGTGVPAGVLSLGPGAKTGQETVTPATHLLASSGSHPASKHLSSS